MQAKYDLTGQKFNRLTVVKFLFTDKHRMNKWECLCECGNNTVVNSQQLKNGGTKSCGCYKTELCGKLKKIIHGYSRRGKKTAEYKIWEKIKDRCNDMSDENYGGRGISICERWAKNFVYFLEDMGLRPNSKLSVERINNDGDYEPSNCKWGTKKEQDRNKRTNHWEEYNGERLVVTDWAIKLGVDNRHIHRMLKKKTFSQVYEYYMNKQKAS